MSEEWTLEEDMQPGTVYHVKIDDCCVEGWFISRFVKRVDITEFSTEYHFENGFVLLRGGWIKEAEKHCSGS